MINRAGYTWRGLPASETEGLTEAGAIKLAMARPVIEYEDGSVTVGFTTKVKELFEALSSALPTHLTAPNAVFPEKGVFCKAKR